MTKTICSLTSYPPRLPYADSTVYSLLNQNKKFDEVVMYLSKDEVTTIPKELAKLKEMFPEFRIQFVPGNLRSYKKLYYALQDYSTDDIITADDDIYFPRDMTQRLYDCDQRNPNSVSSIRTRQVKLTKDGALDKYKNFDLIDDSHMYESSVFHLSTNGAGSLFRRKYFPDKFFDHKTFMSLCPTTDDLWIHFMLVINGVETAIAKQTHMFPLVQETQSVKLATINNGVTSMNDIALNNLTHKFPEYLATLKSKVR